MDKVGLRSIGTGLLILLGIWCVAYSLDKHIWWILVAGDLMILAGLDLRYKQW